MRAKHGLAFAVAFLLAAVVPGQRVGVPTPAGPECR